MKALTIIVPEAHDIFTAPVILTHDLNSKELESAFDELDAELHDETYKDLDKLVSTLRTQVEDLSETIDKYEELIEDLEHRKVV